MNFDIFRLFSQILECEGPSLGAPNDGAWITWSLLSWKKFDPFYSESHLPDNYMVLFAPTTFNFTLTSPFYPDSKSHLPWQSIFYTDNMSFCPNNQSILHWQPVPFTLKTSPFYIDKSLLSWQPVPFILMSSILPWQPVPFTLTTTPLCSNNQSPLSWQPIPFILTTSPFYSD